MTEGNNTSKGARGTGHEDRSSLDTKDGRRKQRGWKYLRAKLPGFTNVHVSARFRKVNVNVCSCDDSV